MYEEHPDFLQPENANGRVWRYMDFVKFVTLLQSRALYFTRADKFDDPFEGSYPRMNVALRAAFAETADLPSPEARENLRKALQDLGFSNRRWREFIGINCWHLNDHESAAMWRLYLKSNDGIAVQSTYGRLRDAFKNIEERVFLGTVQYVDYEHEVITQRTIFSPFLHK